MATVVPLMNFFGLEDIKLSKSEKKILEAELLIRLHAELKEYLRQKYTVFFKTLKLTAEEENAMLDGKFVVLLINDILSTEQYDLNGVALYTNTPEDVIYDLFISVDPSPSANFQIRIIELHRSVRKELYDHIIKKTIGEILKKHSHQFEVV